MLTTEECIKAHAEDLKIIQKTVIVLLILTFAGGLAIGIFISILFE